MTYMDRIKAMTYTSGGGMSVLDILNGLAREDARPQYEPPHQVCSVVKDARIFIPAECEDWWEYPSSIERLSCEEMFDHLNTCTDDECLTCMALV